jgi:hypothetical protein
VFYGAIFAGMFVAYMIWGPEEPDVVVKAGPDALYIGMFEESVSFFYLHAVNRNNEPLYKRWTGPICSVGIHFCLLGGKIGGMDTLYYTGTLVYRGWDFPYFRVWRLREMKAVFVGLASKWTGDIYRLRKGGFDGYIYDGPYVTPESEIEMAMRKPWNR